MKAVRNLQMIVRGFSPKIRDQYSRSSPEEYQSGSQYFLSFSFLLVFWVLELGSEVAGQMDTAWNTSRNIVIFPIQITANFNADSCEAPILKEVDNDYHMVRFNGSFMKENVFRLPGGPESRVDAAWESLGIDCKHARSSLLKTY